MTSVVFRALGALLLLGGLAWALYGFGVEGTSSAVARYVMAARLQLALPGTAMAFLGLLFLGAGSALSRLNQIARETSYTANKTAAMAEALDRLSRGRSAV